MSSLNPNLGSRGLGLRSTVKSLIELDSLLAAAPASGMISVRFRFRSLQLSRCFRREGGALEHFKFPDLASAMKTWSL